MGKIIPFFKDDPTRSNIITANPLQMRWADWEGGNSILVLKEDAVKFELHRRAVLNGEHSHISYVPNHISIKNGMESTLNALLRYKEQPDKMQEIYFLAGLMECLINVPQPVLRTALIRSYYQKVFDLKNKLNVRWHSRATSFLFPMRTTHYSHTDFHKKLSEADTLQKLLGEIRQGVEEQFFILGKEYVFYIPRAG